MSGQDSDVRCEGCESCPPCGCCLCDTCNGEWVCEQGQKPCGCIDPTEPKIGEMA